LPHTLTIENLPFEGIGKISPGESIACERVEQESASVGGRIEEVIVVASSRQASGEGVLVELGLSEPGFR
jgi:hypothetical protein